jgi:Arc/MetJ-type ribon-helix-helix transcriptional regulator
MRNYWLKILLGAFGIFVVGMLGVTMARKGMQKAKLVVSGNGPISIPLAFVPFNLAGSKLGTIDRVTLLRDAPKHVTAVELELNLQDSLVAQGLAGCRLAANLDSEKNRQGFQVHAGQWGEGTFVCLRSDSAKSDSARSDSASADFVEYGHALLKPANVTIPLLLPSDMAKDLAKGDFDSDSEAMADSIAEAAEAHADSVAQLAKERAESIGKAEGERGRAIGEAAKRRAERMTRDMNHMADSLRKVGAQRADSIRRAVSKEMPAPPNPPVAEQPRQP